ncbi:MAG: hypothetical protein ABEJ94_07420 [Halorientalis sp.]
MAIKCSLLGHKFGGTEVEEEREEQGSEVVVTIKEVEICDRCGERRVVSENKEVTSLAAAGEGDSEPDPAPESKPEPEPGPGPESNVADAGGTGPDVSAAEDDAELLDAGGDGDDTGAGDDATGIDDTPGAESDEQPEPDIATAGEAGGDEPAAEDDGAVILDDEEPERDPGEWPDEGDGEAGQPADDAEPAAEEPAGESAAESTAAADEGHAASPGEEWPDEYGYEEESATAPEVDWPEEDEGDDEDWEPGESLTQRIDADAEPVGTATATVPEGEFYCPECEFTTPVEESSLRAGDFCPSCHRGTLEHRAEDATRKE